MPCSQLEDLRRARDQRSVAKSGVEHDLERRGEQHECAEPCERRHPALRTGATRGKQPIAAEGHGSALGAHVRGLEGQSSKRRTSRAPVTSKTRCTEGSPRRRRSSQPRSRARASACKQQPQAGGVDERKAPEVDDEPRRILSLDLVEARFQLPRAREIEFAGERDAGRAVFDGRLVTTSVPGARRGCAHTGDSNAPAGGCETGRADGAPGRARLQRGPDALGLEVCAETVVAMLAPDARCLEAHRTARSARRCPRC